jgi:hypothetical protein
VTRCLGGGRPGAIVGTIVSVAALALLARPYPAAGQESPEPASADSVPAQADSVESRGPRVGHGSKGFEIETADGKYLIQLQARLQFRYAYPFDQDPVTFDEVSQDQHTFKANRARLKVGGHAFEPWIQYFFEYELAGTALLDFRVSLEKLPWLKLKVGQWKAHYSRERVISSGRQQLLDRSHINRPFTIDRQQGVSLFGRLQGGGPADFSYWASVFTGMGRVGGSNDDTHLMWMGRLQWNFLGREVPFGGSDLDRRDQPAGLLALAGVTNRSPYTRFSTAGGGQLPGFGEGEAGQYRVKQALIETAFLFGGLAWQQELHWKTVDDRLNGAVTRLMGNYAQLGYFFHEIWKAFPRPLELAVRHSIYDPNRDRPDDLEQEFSLAANWFFAGHLNKLTAELGYLTYDEPGDDDPDGWRFRLQWDISM